MRKTRISLLLVIILAVSAIPFSLFIINVTGAPSLPDYEPLRMDANFGSRNLPISGVRTSGVKTSGGLHASPAEGEYYEEGDIMEWLSLDDYYGYYYWTDFELRKINDVAEIWVQTDLSYGWDIFGGTFEDPRADPIVTDDQLQYLLDEFTNNIYPVTTEYFGTPDYHDGNNGYWPGDYNASAREVILIHNFKDDAYYYPDYPYYIAGFYSSSFEGYFDRNIINIDSHNWEDRIGPDVSRPYLYESIIAHEYQHLIHADYNPSDPSWMNEACSMFAEPLCGYPIDYGAIRRFLFTPDNGLNVWGDQGDINILADYGSSFLWAMYLNDHYGGAEFFSRFVQAGIPGEEGIDATLDFLGYEESFMDIFHDWRIANLVHSGDGKYNYKSIDLSEDNEELEGVQLTVQEVPGKKIPWTYAGSEFGTTFSLDGDDTGISGVSPFGSEYLSFPDLKGLNKFKFDGDELAFVPVDDYDRWTYDGEEWYSGMESLTNSLIATPIHVEGAGAVLTLDTKWDIEDEWDFAFVQVCTTDGLWESEWTSLELEGVTTDVIHPDAHPNAYANLPGFYGYSDYTTLVFDLSAYEDQDIYIGFRYVTDWAFEYEGWYLRGVTYTDAAGLHDIEADLTPVYPAFPEADFLVTIVTKMSFFGHDFYFDYDMCLNSLEYGWTLTFDTRKIETIVIVTPISSEGYADYQFKVSRLGGRRRWF